MIRFIVLDVLAIRSTPAPDPYPVEQCTPQAQVQHLLEDRLDLERIVHDSPATRQVRRQLSSGMLNALMAQGCVYIGEEPEGARTPGTAELLVCVFKGSRELYAEPVQGVSGKGRPPHGPQARVLFKIMPERISMIGLSSAAGGIPVSLGSRP